MISGAMYFPWENGLVPRIESLVEVISAITQWTLMIVVAVTAHRPRRRCGTSLEEIANRR